MSIVFDEVSIKGLRKAHFEQLLSYINQREADEWHYGNKDQFEQRHADLVKWVTEIIDKASNPEYIIPKK